MKFLGMLSLLLVLSCGKSGNKSGTERSTQSLDPYSCQNFSLSCIDKSDWFIVSSRPFPRKFSVSLIMIIDGHEYNDEIMNACRNSAFDFDNTIPRKSILHFISSHRIPQDMSVRLDIRNLGEDCGRDDVFFAGFIPSPRVENRGGSVLHYRQTLELQNDRRP